MGSLATTLAQLLSVAPRDATADSVITCRAVTPITAWQKQSVSVAHYAVSSALQPYKT